ncbi:MAG: hypothetical protein AAB442_02210 [Patescibacteria group bacterium]
MRSRFSITRFSIGLVVSLFVVYLGLIAVVMSYASVTIAFSQSIKSDESAVAQLEAAYLTEVERITSIDARALGYAAPVAKWYVPTRGGTALR